MKGAGDGRAQKKCWTSYWRATRAGTVFWRGRADEALTKALVEMMMEVELKERPLSNGREMWGGGGGVETREHHDRLTLPLLLLYEHPDVCRCLTYISSHLIIFLYSSCVSILKLIP
jgi:hypothetical protein